MLIRTLRKLGITSDMAFLAAGGSILTSIIAWRVRSKSNTQHAERLGIFIGLWAPTFTTIGAALKLEEDLHGTKADPQGAWNEIRGSAAKGAEKMHAGGDAAALA